MIQAKRLTEDQLVLLEALVRSPVLGALTQVIENYKAECYGVLTTSKDPNMIFETQGRLKGAHVITELPKIIVQQREKAKEQEAEKESQKRSIEERKQKLLAGKP